jgi:hypothetical protein
MGLFPDDYFLMPETPCYPRIMSAAFDALVEEYPAFWIDFLGEHNHIGGAGATTWLLQRASLGPDKKMLDCGAFVGAAARIAAMEAGANAVASDINRDFLAAGHRMEGGELVQWVPADSRKLPFRAQAFDSVWALDTYLAPRELSRVAAATASLCLSCEVPVDSRGGVEAFIEEWGTYGWRLTAHKQMSLEAAQAWRRAEGDLVAHHTLYESRYGKRGYLHQLDVLAELVRTYTTHEQGHGLFVFKREP